MTDEPIIPEFRVYEIEDAEREELVRRLADPLRRTADPFRSFTDTLAEYVATGEWKNHSDGFLSMIAKACFLRGMYGYNQILSKGTKNVVCRGYAAASLCRQSLDPRWVNNLQTYVNQAWQASNYIAFAELAGQHATLLIELGYTERAKTIAMDTIERVTEATKNDKDIRNRVQAALLDCHLALARVAVLQGALDEALIRLDAAAKTANALNHRLAEAKIAYERAVVLENSKEYEEAVQLVNYARTQFEMMGYLDGLAQAMNLLGVIFLSTGRFQDARDMFEDEMIITQQLNNQIGLVRSLINIGEVDRALGQLEPMEKYNRKALEISQEAEYVRGLVVATINLGGVALRKGEPDEAVKRYEEAAQISSKSGMKSLKILSHLLAGDVHALQGHAKGALAHYEEARRTASEVLFPLSVFLADVSILSVHWQKSNNAPSDLLDRIREKVGRPEDWEGNSDLEQMRRIRQRIFEKKSLTSTYCVFFDPELDFQCRVDRKTMNKECYGNIRWMQRLCPFLKAFINRLAETTEGA